MPAMTRRNEEMLRAIRHGVARAIRRHKLLGESIAVLKDGHVVIVPPEEIVVPEGASDFPSDDANEVAKKI